ncbi:hypothetical protein I7I50_00984 [Histoplasma capsulatum G186AR]|uniref:Uncharacterized protein n=1 Tax=Ajellomyces capsulatus TaxID=5037 RepID=A0A8H8CV81_AJECA|nr:hypothetical protein I7I52_08250 [Histoplasma capsulatum]QSS72975.1 hypothetical protein I7I50_00984 [Histoplasma capsulatum G186AR]
MYMYNENAIETETSPFLNGTSYGFDRKLEFTSSTTHSSLISSPLLSSPFSAVFLLFFFPPCPPKQQLATTTLLHSAMKRYILGPTTSLLDLLISASRCYVGRVTKDNSKAGVRILH